MLLNRGYMRITATNGHGPPCLQFVLYMSQLRSVKSSDLDKRMFNEQKCYGPGP
jgi:hypothetical protein